MSCEARTYADGSWFCQKCEIGGDKDEPVEEFCKLTRSNGSAVRPLSERDPEAWAGVTEEVWSGHGPTHSHPADR